MLASCWFMGIQVLPRCRDRSSSQFLHQRANIVLAAQAATFILPCYINERTSVHWYHSVVSVCFRTSCTYWQSFADFFACSSHFFLICLISCANCSFITVFAPCLSPPEVSFSFRQQNIGANPSLQSLTLFWSFLQNWWLNRQHIAISFVHRASMCFIRRLLRHTKSCIDSVNTFFEVISGLSAQCGLSRRDVSQCVGPFDQVLLCLSRIQHSAATGDNDAFITTWH